MRMLMKSLSAIAIAALTVVPGLAESTRVDDPIMMGCYQCEINLCVSSCTSGGYSTGVCYSNVGCPRCHCLN